MKGAPDRNSNPSPAAVLLAVVFAILTAAGLVARFWAVDREHAITGPTHITAGAAGVFVHVSGDILHLSAVGELQAAHGADITGLADMPIDLRLLDSGELLIASQQPASIRLCNIESWSCRAIDVPFLAAIERQFKVLDHGESFVLTDARGDSLWRLGENGLDEVLPRKTLAGPNGLTADAAGNVWVADTDHRRILELLPQGDGTFVTGREHSAMNGLTVGVRHYPVMIESGADGRIWVAQAADFSKAKADLVVYDPEKGAEAIVDLPADAYATDVAVLGDDVLVTDMDRFSIYRVETSTMSVRTFGGESLADHLQVYREERAMYGRLAKASLAAVIVVAAFLILVVFRITPRERRWSQPPAAIDLEAAAKSVPETRGVHWLEKHPRTRWMGAWFERAYYLLFGLLCLVSTLIYAWSCNQPWGSGQGGLSGADMLGLLLLSVCMVTASFIPMIHAAAGVFRRRLGTDGRQVHIELEDGRRLSVWPDQLAWNKRAVFYREYTFPLQTGLRSPLYTEDEVQKWLAPLLRDSVALNEWQTLKHQFRHRDRVLLATVGAIVFIGFILLLIEFVFKG